jgi:plasmid stabilization system protein ParE
MAYKIIWLPRAEKRFEQILNYLEQNWGNNEVKAFIKRTNAIINIITHNPKAFRYSKSKRIYEAVETKHNLLLYRTKYNTIELLTFFDVRQHPNKK